MADLIITGFDRFQLVWFILLFLSSFDVTFISSFHSGHHPITFPPPPNLSLPSCPPCLAYRTLYPPCLGYNSLIILLPISFKPRPHPKAFSPFPLHRFIIFLSRVIPPISISYTGSTAGTKPLDARPAPNGSAYGDPSLC